MATEPRRIDSEITLIPYYPNEDVALAWYQDPELCRQVDNRPEPYTPERLRAMYTFLSSHGKCYYIEYRGRLVGDVTLRDDGEIAIVVCREYQNRGIGRRCVREMLALARESGMDEARANIYAFNEQSRRMFEAAGFEPTDEEWYACRVQDIGEKTMVFDKAGNADITRLVALRLAYLAEDGGVSPEDEALIRRDLPDYFRRHLGHDLIGFVAREGGDIVACALLLMAEKPMSPAFINGRTGTVLNVYTRPERRGRGYARRLMEMLMDEATRLEICRVELKATDMGRGLYRSLGFEDGASRYRPMQWRPAK